MPRKKRINPDPLRTDTFDDELIVETHDKSTWPIKGQGQHKYRDYMFDKFSEVLDKVANDYLTPSGRKTVDPDYMKSGKAFARQCEIWAYGGEDGADDSALRKRLYKDIQKELSILEAAIESTKKQQK